MGVHVSVMDAKFRDHPRWDCGRMGGDRELVAIVGSVKTTRIDKPTAFDEGSSVDRPVDMAAFRQILRDRFGEMNAERWETLCDILDSDPGLGIHFGF